MQTRGDTPIQKGQELQEELTLEVMPTTIVFAKKEEDWKELQKWETPYRRCKRIMEENREI